MAYSIEIINKNGKKFRFQEAECKNVDYNMNTKFLKQSLPDADAEDTIIINLGRDRNVSVPFQLRETTVDASDGTATSPVLTVQEKYDYLNDVILTDGITDLYTVNITTTAVSMTGIVGIADSLNFNPTAEKPNILPGLFSLAVGGAQQ